MGCGVTLTGACLSRSRDGDSCIFITILKAHLPRKVHVKRPPSLTSLKRVNAYEAVQLSSFLLQKQFSRMVKCIRAHVRRSTSGDRQRGA